MYHTQFVDPWHNPQAKKQTNCIFKQSEGFNRWLLSSIHRQSPSVCVVSLRASHHSLLLSPVTYVSMTADWTLTSLRQWCTLASSQLLKSLIIFCALFLLRTQRPATISTTMIQTPFPDMTPLMKTSEWTAEMWHSDLVVPHFFYKSGTNLPLFWQELFMNMVSLVTVLMGMCLKSFCCLSLIITAYILI